MFVFHSVSSCSGAGCTRVAAFGAGAAAAAAPTGGPAAGPAVGPGLGAGPQPTRCGYFTAKAHPATTNSITTPTTAPIIIPVEDPPESDEDPDEDPDEDTDEETELGGLGVGFPESEHWLAKADAADGQHMGCPSMLLPLTFPLQARHCCPTLATSSHGGPFAYGQGLSQLHVPQDLGHLLRTCAKSCEV